MAIKMLRAGGALEEEKREAEQAAKYHRMPKVGWLADPQLLPAPRSARQGRPHGLPGGQFPKRAGRQHPRLPGCLPALTSGRKLAARHGGRSLYFNSVTCRERPPVRSGRL